MKKHKLLLIFDHLPQTFRIKLHSGFFIALCGLLLFSCSAGGTKKEAANANPSPLSSQKEARTLNADDFAGKLDELLTLEMAAKVSGFEASKAIKEHEDKASAVFGGEKKPPRECNYLWKNGRIRAITAGGHTINAPYKDKVGIKYVSNTTLERFKQSYGVLTDEQKTAASKKLDEEASKNQPEQARTETEKKVAEVGTGMIKNLKAEEITGVGDAATWYPNFSELKVLYNGLTFALVTDISDDKNLNRNKSIELANMIIDEKLK